MAKKKENIEIKLNKIRGILDALEDDSIGFEESIKLFEEGKTLIEECKTYLEETQLSFEKLED